MACSKLAQESFKCLKVLQELPSGVAQHIFEAAVTALHSDSLADRAATKAARLAIANIAVSIAHDAMSEFRAANGHCSATWLSVADSLKLLRSNVGRLFQRQSAIGLNKMEA